jgi:hypothetical protein
MAKYTTGRVQLLLSDNKFFFIKNLQGIAYSDAFFIDSSFKKDIVTKPDNSTGNNQ